MSKQTRRLRRAAAGHPPRPARAPPLPPRARVRAHERLIGERCDDGAAVRTQARADELEDYITEELLSADLLDVLKQVKELNPEKSDPQPQQRLIWRGGGGTLTEAVLKAVKACASEATLKNDADILVKGKLALDQTVLPPLLRIFAATCLSVPAHK